MFYEPCKFVWDDKRYCIFLIFWDDNAGMLEMKEQMILSDTL